MGVHRMSERMDQRKHQNTVEVRFVDLVVRYSGMISNRETYGSLEVKIYIYINESTSLAVEPRRLVAVNRFWVIWIKIQRHVPLS